MKQVETVDVKQMKADIIDVTGDAKDKKAKKKNNADAMAAVVKWKVEMQEYFH